MNDKTVTEVVLSPIIPPEQRSQVEALIVKVFADKDSGKIEGGMLHLTPQQLTDLYWYRDNIVKILSVETKTCPIPMSKENGNE
jgi:hypothetical protein